MNDSREYAQCLSRANANKAHNTEVLLAYFQNRSFNHLNGRILGSLCPTQFINSISKWKTNYPWRHAEGQGKNALQHSEFIENVPAGLILMVARHHEWTM
jgi:hypothetical protein